MFLLYYYAQRFYLQEEKSHNAGKYGYSKVDILIILCDI